jgi:hypothetical protein
MKIQEYLNNVGVTVYMISWGGKHLITLHPVQFKRLKKMLENYEL